MKICKCNVKYLKSKDETKDGLTYDYYKCSNCGEGFLNLKQLDNLAEKYRNMKKYQTKVAKWGLSSAIRIPKDMLKKYNLKNSDNICLIEDEKCIKIVPA